MKTNQNRASAFILIIALAGLLFTCIAALAWAVPTYWVWQKGKAGEAQLMEARQNRQIIIEEAEARLASAKLDAQSEEERAIGMAKAMDIENGKLTPLYNQYLFIRSLEKLAQQGDLPQIIYLPSEGMMPVMDLKQPTP